MTTVGWFGKVKFNDSGYALKLLGNKIEVAIVNEPTDINWIAQGNSNYKIFCRTFLMRIFMALFLTALLFSSTLIGEFASRAEKRYPRSFDCNEI